MRKESGQENPIKQGPFDQEEQEQQLSDEELRIHPDDLPVGLGYDDDERREAPSDTNY